MSAGTHTSSWRSLLALAPPLGVAGISLGALQGEPDIALSPYVYLVLAPVSLVGWWVARQLTRLLTDTPVVPVARARAGYIALRGVAQPMPSSQPLTSPNGTPCVWYRHNEQTAQAMKQLSSYRVSDSAQPFLLVDSSGRCIVLPAGADITGGHESAAPGGREQLIAAGDTIYVAGNFMPPSDETFRRLRSVEPEPARVTMSFDSPDALRAAEGRGQQLLDQARAAQAATLRTPPAAPLLPVICAPDHFAPFVITAKAGANEAGWYRLLANANLAVLLASTAMLAYLILSGRQFS